jgi:hypothetical protein
MKILNFILGLAISLLSFTTGHATPAPEGDAVEIIKGTRITRQGDQIDYLLLIPMGETRSSTIAYPALLMNHGFSRDYSRHIDNAIFFAAAGMIVMVPNLTEAGQTTLIEQKEVDNVADHLRWLIDQGEDPSSPLYEILDSKRIAIAGHSAGGALSLEATVVLQDEGIPPSGLLLWDAVPYLRTFRAATGLEPLPLLILRASPKGCNAFGAIERLTSKIPFPLQTTLIPGTSHCDFESPTDITCELACGKSTELNRLAFRDLGLIFLRQIFGL